MKVLLSGAMVAALLCGCTRPRVQPAATNADCVEDERLADTPSRVTVTAGPAGSELAGVVVLADAGAPLSDALVWVDGKRAEGVKTGPDGRFAFPGLTAGHHAIAMSRLGMYQLRDSVTIPVAGELRIEARPFPFDGCTGFGEVVVGKP